MSIDKFTQNIVYLCFIVVNINGCLCFKGLCPCDPTSFFGLIQKTEAKKIKAAPPELKNSALSLNKSKLAALKQRFVFNASASCFSLRSGAEAGLLLFAR